MEFDSIAAIAAAFNKLGFTFSTPGGTGPPDEVDFELTDADGNVYRCQVWKLSCI